LLLKTVVQEKIMSIEEDRIMVHMLEREEQRALAELDREDKIQNPSKWDWHWMDLAAAAIAAAILLAY